MPKVNLFLPLFLVFHDCRHQVTRPEAVVQRLLEEDAFKQKRYNHPLGYIINMILTYFESKVNLLGVIHSSIHRAETIIEVVFAKKNERSESFVPELLVTV